MTAEEAKDCLKTLNRLFPLKVNVDQGKLFIRDVLPFDHAAALKCIEQHRMSQPTKNGFAPEPSFPALLEAMKTVDRDGRAASKAAADARKDESWADVHRRISPNASMKVAGDVEVCLRVHRIWWHGCRKLEAYRALFAHSCRMRLGELGAQEPDRLADAVFDDSADWFHQVLEELRGNLALGAA